MQDNPGRYRTNDGEVAIAAMFRRAFLLVTQAVGQVDR